MKKNGTQRLNENQYQAVNKFTGPLLILAGAGSGKTRVITFRILNMLAFGIPQSAILALTFTNKAAREMRERIASQTDRPCKDLVISTFHSFGLRLLKKYCALLGYKKKFSIFDQSDKQSLIKEIALEMDFTRDSLDLFQLDSLFSAVKTQRHTWTVYTKTYEKLYEEYQSHLKLYSALDFDDLIVLPLKLLTTNSAVLQECRKQYQYIMVDEFQDTSSIQYHLVHLLSSESRNLCVVGDDDQSIYSWRGACFANILSFEADFPERLEIRLEQNYRSTQNILSAANAVIALNTNRKPKELWTASASGDPLRLFYAADERTEAEFIATTIKSIRFKERVSYRDFGVLVRTNNLTRSIEEAFLTENLPYKVSGGMSFFGRKEVKDILSYLRLIANPDDDINFLRIINLPRRGLGKKTIEILNDLHLHKKCSLYSALAVACAAADSPFPEKQSRDLKEFYELIEKYRTAFDEEPRNMAKKTLALVEEIGYWTYLLEEHKKPETAKWKYANVESLVNSIAEYEKNPDNMNIGLQQYLNRITLLTKEDTEEDSGEDKINLMTIHASKGLEFDAVFLASVEKDIIPHLKTIEEAEENIEEERRLFYVALTRAKRKLYLSVCLARNKRGAREESGPSPFLEEIPQEIIEILESEEYSNKEEASFNFSAIKEMFKG